MIALPPAESLNGTEAAVYRLFVILRPGSHRQCINLLAVSTFSVVLSLSAILPALTRDEALDVAKLFTVCGLLPWQASLLSDRPFRSPHHAISDAGMIGGGAVPRPGEVNLARTDALFLDELPEFQRGVLEVLR
jgi:predicted ATPase with chaperone activity